MTLGVVHHTNAIVWLQKDIENKYSKACGLKFKYIYIYMYFAMKVHETSC